MTVPLIGASWADASWGTKSIAAPRNIRARRHAFNILDLHHPRCAEGQSPFELALGLVNGGSIAPARRGRAKRTPNPRTPTPKASWESEVGNWALAKRLELRPETELYHPRLIRQRGARERFSELRVRPVERERLEVRAVEHVEHLDNAVHLHLAAKREALLWSHVNPLDRRLVEAIACDECAVGQEPPARAALQPRIESRGRGREAVVAEDVETAHLETFRRFPDAVERRTVPLRAGHIPRVLRHVGRKSNRHVTD